MFKIRKIISMVLIAAVVIVTTGTSTYAKTTVTKSSVTYNGVTYEIQESFNENGNKVVVVSGAGEINTVVNNGDELIITKETKQGITETNYSLNESNNTRNMTTQTYGSLYTLFWNYGYYYSDSYEDEYGLYWSLDSGDSSGSYSSFDYDNGTARDYAESFMGNVQSIQNNQAGAVSAMGFAAASAVAGAITAETGVGAIVGIVLAMGGALGSAGFWVSAYTSSVSANYNFSRFKSILD